MSSAGSSGDSNASGKFSWRVHNFPLFREMIKTQKIMSPVFLVGECSLRLSVYQSSVSGVDYLSMWCVKADKDAAKLDQMGGWVGGPTNCVTV